MRKHIFGSNSLKMQVLLLLFDRVVFGVYMGCGLGNVY